MASMQNSTGSDSRFRLLRRGIRVLALAVITCTLALVATPALAQKKKDEPEKVDKSYTLPYFFSGLAVLMVVVPLCFPSMRKTEIPKEEDD